MKNGTRIKVHTTKKCGCLNGDDAYLNKLGIYEKIKNETDKHIVFFLDMYPKDGGWFPYVGCSKCIKEVKE